MGKLAEDHERNIKDRVLVRSVRVKSWEELLECGSYNGLVIEPEDGHTCFTKNMKDLCGRLVKIDATGHLRSTGYLSLLDILLEPWMYDEMETPDPRADERLQHNEEYQERRKVQPRLGPCLSCGEIEVLDMEGAMGECMDCLHASRKSFEAGVTKVLENIKEILLQKNRKYGGSVLNPSRIFAKSDAVEQIKVRIDDKLKRIQNRQDDEDEDVETDLLWYLVLLKIAKGGEE